MFTLACIIVAFALLPAALRTARAGLIAIDTWADLTLAPWLVQAAVATLGFGGWAVAVVFARGCGF